jgi:hypothetical protein
MSKGFLVGSGLFLVVGWSSGCSKKPSEPPPDESWKLYDSLEAYCGDAKPELVAGIGTYSPSSVRHGVVAIVRTSDDRRWLSGGLDARPLNRDAPTDKGRIDAVACVDEALMHELEYCEYVDEHGIRVGRHRGRGVAKIRFLDARTAALIVEARVEASKDPPPCDSSISLHDEGPVTQVEAKDVAVVLERFRTGALNPISTPEPPAAPKSAGKKGQSSRSGRRAGVR